MTIRMKGKHIVLTLVAALLLAVLGVGYTTTDSAEELYSTACSYLPALQQAQKPNALYLFANGKMWSGDGTAASFQEAERLLQKVISQYPESIWAKHAHLRLAELYLMQEDYAAAEKYARLVLQYTEGSDYLARTLLLDVMERQGRTGEALDLIEETLAVSSSSHVELRFRKARLLAKLEKYDQARQLLLELPEQVRQEYSQLIETEGREVYEYNVAVWDHRIEEYLKQLDVLAQGTSQARVSGVITYLGRGVAGIEVRLVPAAEAGSYLPPSWNEAPRCITDGSGKFAFNKVAPGSYTLALVLDREQVKSEALVGHKCAPTITVADSDIELNLQLAPLVDLVSPPPGAEVTDTQIRFVWEPVPGAQQYTLRIGWQEDGCGTTIDYATGINDTQYTVDINSAFLNQIVIRDGQGVLQPETLLGPFKLHDSIYWEVEAYDSEGRLLASSRQSRSKQTVSLEYGGLSEAEQHLANKNYPAAIKVYEQRLAVNPQDAEALLMLARLYHYGWVSEERDYSKAASYYRQYLQIKNDPAVRTLFDQLQAEMDR